MLTSRRFGKGTKEDGEELCSSEAANYISRRERLKSQRRPWNKELEGQVSDLLVVEVLNKCSLQARGASVAVSLFSRDLGKMASEKS